MPLLDVGNVSLCSVTGVEAMNTTWDDVFHESTERGVEEIDYPMSSSTVESKFECDHRCSTSMGNVSMVTEYKQTFLAEFKRNLTLNLQETM